MTSLLRILLIFAMAGWSSLAHAQLSFTLTSGNDATGLQRVAIDSNKCPSQGPSSSFTGGLITNVGGTAITGIDASLGGLSNSFFLAGGQASSQFVGTLQPGESIPVFWFISYSCTDGLTSGATWSLTYDGGSNSGSYSLQTQQSKSANAGGNVLSFSLGPHAVVGQVVDIDVTYDFGGTDVGDEYYVQPAGTPDFNAACFRLVGSEVVSSNLTAFTTGPDNHLYYVQPSAQPGNNYSAVIRYSFEYLCAGASTTARPYAAQTSGVQLKYTGNFDSDPSIQISVPGGDNPFTITKSGTPDSVVINGDRVATYTVTVFNPSTVDSYISSIVDALPPGATFLAIDPSSDVTLANSASTPAAGDSGTITFNGNPRRSYSIPAGGSVALVYTATLQEAVGDYTNTAYATFGQASTATASATISVFSANLEVTKTSAPFSDPVNGTSNPFVLPDGVLRYTITVTNPNPIALTSESVVITDSLPAGLTLLTSDISGTGSGPVIYNDDDAGLDYEYVSLSDLSDDLEFSDDGGLTWDFEPDADGDGFEAGATHFRLRPTGTMGAGASISISFDMLIP